MLRSTLLLLVLLCTCVSAQLHADPTDPALPVIKKILVVDHLGREHFKIRTPTATYLYDPMAGSFSAIIDKLGNDWVGYRDGEKGAFPAGAATNLRGLPNLIAGGKDDGAGHPGQQKCESRIVGRNQIHTVSLSGDWAWTWTFYRDAAKLEIITAPANKAYHFRYEGPVGGAYRPLTTFWATERSEPSYEMYDHAAGNVYQGNHRYWFLGEDQSPYVFFMLQTTPDEHPDNLSFLGSEDAGARESMDGMVVAGFGSGAEDKPLLHGPNTFLIGLTSYSAQDPLSVARTRQRLEKIARIRGKMKVILP